LHEQSEQNKVKGQYYGKRALFPINHPN